MGRTNRRIHAKIDVNGELLTKNAIPMEVKYRMLSAQLRLIALDDMDPKRFSWE